MAIADPVEATLHAGAATEVDGEPPAGLREGGRGRGGEPHPLSGRRVADMEWEVEGRGAGLDGRDVVAPLRTVGATVLGSVGDGQREGTTYLARYQAAAL